MSVLDGSDVIYVARAPTRRRIMAVSIAVGTRFPAHATSMGRVLLAHLDPGELDASLASTELTQLTASTVHDEATLRRVLAHVRERGDAIVDQELEEGLRAAAAPVRGADGKVVAAVNVSVHASRASVADIEERLVPPLLDAVAEITADLGTLTRRR